ncbi:MAG: hypothetical protein Q9212_004250 [Teloschistes hypoglaucus]
MGLPGLYLTYSWGAVLSKNAIAALLNASKRIIRGVIVNGHGDDHLPLYFGNLVVPYAGLVLTVRPFQDRVLTYNDIYSAVGLLERCAYSQGEREEMWSLYPSAVVTV